jgi:hypothetical protein
MRYTVPIIKKKIVIQNSLDPVNARGHDTVRIITAISFQAKTLGIPGTGALLTATGADMPLYPAERTYLCSIEKIMPDKPIDALVDSVARKMAALMHRPVDMVKLALKNTKACKPVAAVAAAKAKPKVIRLSASGVVISTNPVWNACISGMYISPDLLKANTDVSHYQRGHTDVTVPLTCSDYRRTGKNAWQHPDFADLVLTLDKKGRPVGKLPAGYVTVKDKKPAAGSGATVLKGK